MYGLILNPQGQGGTECGFQTNVDDGMCNNPLNHVPMLVIIDSGIGIIHKNQSPTLF